MILLSRSTLRFCVVLLAVSSSTMAQEASAGGARRALNQAEQFQKGLEASDPFAVKDALTGALQLVPAMEAMTGLLKDAAGKIAAIRAEVEKKSQNASKQSAAFYQADLKIIKERESDFEDLRVKLEGVVKNLRLKIEKAKANPEVQELLGDEDLIRRSNEAIEKLRGFKLPTVNS